MKTSGLITGQQLAQFAAALERNGWQRQDFDLQEDVFDPRKAEVEAALGEVGVRCLQTEAVKVYRLGPEFDWVQEFADDLEHGKFGRRTMRDTVRNVDYFSIQVPDKPGEAFRVLQALVSGGVNLLACIGRPVGRRARIDVVPEDASRFDLAVKNAGLEFTAEKSGFLIQGEDRPGALAQHLHHLAKAGINVTGVDAMTAGKGRWGAIVWVASKDVDRARGVFGA